MSLGMYIITGFAVFVGVGALVLAWRLVNVFSKEKPRPAADEEQP